MVAAKHAALLLLQALLHLVCWGVVYWLWGINCRLGQEVCELLQRGLGVLCRLP